MLDVPFYVISVFVYVDSIFWPKFPEEQDCNIYGYQICNRDVSLYTAWSVPPLSLSLLCAVSLQWTLDCSEALTVSFLCSLPCLSLLPPLHCLLTVSPWISTSIFRKAFQNNHLWPLLPLLFFRKHQWKSPLIQMLPYLELICFLLNLFFVWNHFCKTTPFFLYVFLCAIFREAAGCFRLAYHRSDAFQCLSE